MEFREANRYAIWCIGRQDLTLKPKQEEGQALFHLYDGWDVFAWFPTGKSI